MDARAILPKTIRFIEQGIRSSLHLGTQLYISLGGKVIANLALGKAHCDTTLQTDSVGLWLSAGKPITAVAIARLWESKQLHLDDAVSRFIPEFGRQGKEGISIRHLLNHTAGFRAADKIPENIEWSRRIEQICQTPLEPGWIPGQKAGYQTNSSWFILGEIVRRTDGRPLEQFVREEIFEPLGMHDCWIGMPKEQFEFYQKEKRIITLHTAEAGELTPHSFLATPPAFTACRPGSGACGPIHQLGRFYEFLLGHFLPTKPIISANAIQTFTSRDRIEMYDHTFLHKLDFGLGFLINSNRYGIETVPYGYGRHASEETFGHSGSQSSCAFADPKYGLVVAWTCNGMPGERLHQKRAREINSAIYEDLRLGV